MYKVYWVTGLAGSGKTTFAKQLSDRLKQMGRAVVLLDGDAVREAFGDERDYTKQGRLKLAWRNARLCKLLSDQDVIVICATISLFHEVQEWNRHHLEGYCEIFMDTPREEILKRDQKNLYSQALAGSIRNVVGIDIAPQFPLSPEFVIQNNEEFEHTLGRISMIATRSANFATS